MREIKIFDTTLRDGEQSPGCSMNLGEKKTMARQLDELGADVIEAGFPVSSPEDHESVREIAAAVKNAAVAALARCTKEDVDAAWDAVKGAVRPRIHVFIATSDVHMEYKLKMTREQVLSAIKDSVGYARSLCRDVEFSAEDASRSDRDFLAECCETAINAGASTINIPDTVGYAVPDEMFDLISWLIKNAAGMDGVAVSVHCHDDLGLAVANTLAAIRAGASQAECTVNGIGERAGNASLEETVMALRTRADFFGADTAVNTKQIYRSSKLLSTITGVPVPPNKAVVGANAFAHEAGIHQHGVIANSSTYEIMNSADIGLPQNDLVLGKHSGKHALREHLESMGYYLTKESMDRTFARFKVLADKKKDITDQDLEALVMSQPNMVSPVYELAGHMVSTGSGITNTACVKITRDDEEFEEVAMGSGPIDASFKAVNAITGLDVTLESFSLNAVTDGEDALGEAVVKLSYNGRKYTGRGLSTDIIESSIRAYINGINKIMGA